MCLIAAFAWACSFLGSVLSDNGNSPFQISPTPPGTVQPWDRIRKIACLPWVSHVHSGSCLPSENNRFFCQAETLAERLEEVQTELQEQRATGGLGLGTVPAIMQPPSISGLMYFLFGRVMFFSTRENHACNCLFHF